jgi:hypothetical protein
MAKRELWETCKTCKHYQHPEWASGIPGYMVCTNSKADGVGRVDIQRSAHELSTQFCNIKGLWWEAKDDSV